MRGVPIQTVIVEEGDALLIPVGWWHSVEALTTSISLTLSNLRVPANAHIWSWRRAGPEPDPSPEPDLDNAP